MKFIKVMWLLKEIRIILFLLALCISVKSIGQQEILFSNYLLNSYTINPAYVGVEDGVELMASTRTQWIDLEGGPNTNVLSGYGNTGSGGMGFGGVLLQDKIGLSSRFQAVLGVSHKVVLNKKLSLNFGLGLGLTQYKTKWDKIKTIEENDFVYDINNRSELMPLVSGGLYLYSEQFYLGVSSPRLNSGNHSFYNQTRSLYLSSGKAFILNDIFGLKPTILIKVDEKQGLQTDLSLSLLLLDMGAFGGSVRNTDAFVFFAQLHLSEVFTVAYSMDVMRNGLEGYSSGSHELTMVMRFVPRNLLITSPRYF